ncbi:MAG: hypothetical protein KC414_11250 [Romboutsia sp.]|nr:hypothetical protein [Romboutsia sp.]
MSGCCGNSTVDPLDNNRVGGTDPLTYLTLLANVMPTDTIDGFLLNCGNNRTPCERGYLSSLPYIRLDDMEYVPSSYNANPSKDVVVAKKQGKGKHYHNRQNVYNNRLPIINRKAKSCKTNKCIKKVFKPILDK